MLNCQPHYRCALTVAGLLCLLSVAGAAEPDPAETKRKEAVAAFNAGEYTRAERLYLQVIEAKQGRNDQTRGLAHFELAKVYTAMNRFADSRTQLEQALAVYGVVAPNNRKTQGIILNTLGDTLTDLGLYGDAEKHFDQAKALFPADDPELPALRMNQARLYRRLGQHGRSEKLLLSAVEFYGPLDTLKAVDKRRLGNARNTLGNLYVESRQDGKALTQFNEALKVWPSLGKSPSARIGAGSAHSGLGYLHLRSGDFDRAKEEFNRALELLSVDAVEGDLRVAQVQVNLGWVHYREGTYATARKLFEAGEAARSARWEGGKSRNHPELVLSRYNLALVHAALGNVDEAGRRMDQARRSTREFLTAELPEMEFLAQREFLRKQREDWHQVLSLGVADPRLANRSAAWVINQKGITLELGMKGVDAAAAWVGVDAVRAKLDPGTVLVEIAQFRSWDLQPRKGRNPMGSSRYVAWLIPAAGAGSVTLVPLGDPSDAESGKAIDDTISEARTELDRTPKRIDAVKYRGAEKEVLVPLRKLSRLVLDPIRKHVQKGDHLIISPDGRLGEVPWGVLPLNDVKAPAVRFNGAVYAIEHHPFSYVTSGRDLVRAPAEVQSGRSVVIADLDYGPARGGRIEVPTDGESVVAKPFAKLKSSSEEGRTVAELLTTYTGTEPARKVGADVKPADLLRVKHPRVLFVSTHGYSIPMKGDEESRAPLMRTGLAMSGANLSPANYATGQQIRGMELAGTELVMLSACETGRGEVQEDAQGTRSLQQAFQLAGARTVIATQWSVSDRDSTEVMKGFFAQLAGKESKLAALRKAQLAFLNAHTKDKGVAHPFLWGAFTLSGDWR